MKKCAVLSLLLITTILHAEDLFSVVSVNGSARVQRSQKRSWEKVEIGEKFYDNDLVETYFQTKLIMQFGENNVVILGSNSKALLNITSVTEGERTRTEISVTLFNGGVFSKAISNCRVNIYTANAVGVMDSGSVTTVAESKTGETGFQVLAGLIRVRNIAQTKSIDLRSGLTTMIQPNKKPTAPLYITHRHVSVLKHYFGDEYIAMELDASGIKPTEERGSSRRGLTAFSTKSRGYIDEGMHRSIFSLSRIYGSILDDREKSYNFYSPILPAASPVEGNGIVSFESGFGISSHGVSPRIIPSGSYTLGKLTGGLRFSLSGTQNGFSAGFSSAGGLIDKIDHVAFGTPDDFWSVYAGELESVTFGNGLIVDKFTSRSYNNSFHPLGFNGRVRFIDELTVNVFTPSLSSPWFWGMYTRYTLGSYNFGLGYVADFNQYAAMIPEDDMRYVIPPESESLYPDITSKSFSVHCYTFDLFLDVVSRFDFRMQMGMELAQKLFGGNDGFVARMPSFIVDINRTRLGLGLTMELGRLLSNQFNARYFDTRYRIKSDTLSNYMDTVLTPNNMLSKNREAYGIWLTYKMNPLPGIDIDVSWKQDIIARNSILIHISDTTYDKTIPGDFSFELRASINEALFKYFQYAEILLHQSHGRLFPLESMPFSSWTFNGGYRIISIPLFFNIAFETKGNFFYIDTGRERNDQIDGEDMFFEITLGAKWGF